MTTTYTTNKHIAVPGLTDPNWGVTLNNGNFPNVDAAFGAVQTIPVTGASGTITLVSDYPPAGGSYSYVPLVNYITGTPLGNVTISIPAGVGGQFIFWNQTGASTPTITIASAGGGSGVVVIPNGSRITVFADGTNVYLSDDGLIASGLSSLSVSGNTLLNTGFGGSTSIYGDTNHIGTTTVAATSLVAGTAYTIYTVGTTNWTSAGAANNNVGTNFIATGATTGTGTALIANATLRVAGSITPTGVVTPRIQAVSSTSTAPNVNIADTYELAIGAGTIASFPAPSGSPVEGQKLIIRIIPSGAVTITAWNAIYRPINTTLPVALVSGKTAYIGCIYNSSIPSWDVVAITIQS